jgi:hypothetical protein
MCENRKQVLKMFFFFVPLLERTGGEETHA